MKFRVVHPGGFAIVDSLKAAEEKAAETDGLIEVWSYDQGWVDAHTTEEGIDWASLITPDMAESMTPDEIDFYERQQLRFA